MTDADWERRAVIAPDPTDFYQMPNYIRVEMVDRIDQLPSVVRELQLVRTGQTDEQQGREGDVCVFVCILWYCTTSPVNSMDS